MTTREVKAQTPTTFHATCSPRRPGEHADDAVLAFADPAEFAQHMKTVHQARAPKTRFVGKPHRPPKPGTGTWQPKPDAPGARVSWTQWIDGQEVTRTGEIWSAAPGPRCYWVAPDVRSEQEQAVELRIEADGRTSYRGFHSRTTGQ